MGKSPACRHGGCLSDLQADNGDLPVQVVCEWLDRPNWSNRLDFGQRWIGLDPMQESRKVRVTRYDFKRYEGAGSLAAEDQERGWIPVWKAWAHGMGCEMSGQDRGECEDERDWQGKRREENGSVKRGEILGRESRFVTPHEYEMRRPYPLCLDGS
jgi:hypothetical protein